MPVGGHDGSHCLQGVHEAPVYVPEESVSASFPSGALEIKMEGANGPLAPVDVVVLILNMHIGEKELKI